MLEAMQWRSDMGEEADPVGLDICARRERSECDERKDEEDYPHDDIKEDLNENGDECRNSTTVDLAIVVVV